MIASLEGVLQSREPLCVVNVGGLGLAVSITDRSAAGLPAVGETVKFWTHLAVRDDGWTLYGFLDPDELTLFRLLISVNGIGPKLALGMLSNAPATAIALALHTEDEKALVALPGIGRKSAARLIIDLAQKVPPALLAASSAIVTAPAETGDTAPDRAVALDLLASMGLTGNRADQLLRDALADDEDLAADPMRWVRAALRRLT
jgi:holliday junction DNA helicase RuvA